MKYYLFFFILVYSMKGVFLLAQEDKSPTKVNVSPVQVYSSPEKMNVLYVGVENIVKIATNIPVINRKVTAQLASSGDPVKVIVVDPELGRYQIICYKLGRIELIVTNTKSGKTYKKVYRVKRIPDPILKLGMRESGAVSAMDFSNSIGLLPMLINFDFDARCKVQSYTLIHLNKKGDKKSIDAKGGRFYGEVKQEIQKAQSDDIYIFTNVKCRCPGDAAARNVNSLVFEIE